MSGAWFVVIRRLVRVKAGMLCVNVSGGGMEDE